MMPKTNQQTQQERKKVQPDHTLLANEPDSGDSVLQQAATGLSSHATTTLDQQQRSAEKQPVCASEDVRHDISEIVFELLQQHHHEQHLANIKFKQQAMVLAEDQLSLDAAALAAQHVEDVTRFENARFNIFEEFDAKREAWAAAVRTERLLEEEGAKHVSSVASLTAKKQHDDDVAKKNLDHIVKVLRQDGIIAWDQQNPAYHLIYRKIDQAREEAATNRRERHRIHAEHLDALESNWESRKIELRTRTRLGSPERLARVKLEAEYQARLSELVQGWDTVQQRQAKELEALETKRLASYAAILEAYEAAEVQLQNERRQADEWWKDLTENASLRRRSGAGNRSANHKIVCLKENAAVEAEKVATGSEKGPEKERDVTEEQETAAGADDAV